MSPEIYHVTPSNQLTNHLTNLSSTGEKEKKNKVYFSRDCLTLQMQIFIKLELWSHFIPGIPHEFQVLIEVNCGVIY